jgi:hypothetical protein
MKHKQMSFVSNGGNFKLYTVLNGLLFSAPAQPRILFERMLHRIVVCVLSLVRMNEKINKNNKIRKNKFDRYLH